MISLIGYTDRLSARPGEKIAFKVSSTHPEPYTTKLVRIISADPNPDNTGLIQHDVPSALNGQSFPSREQPFAAGSCIHIQNPHQISMNSWAIQLCCYPTLPDSGKQQCLFSAGPIALYIDEKGHFIGALDDTYLVLNKAIRARQWYCLTLSCDLASGRFSLSTKSLGPYGQCVEVQATIPGSPVPAIKLANHVCIAAAWHKGSFQHHFNGKIENPALYNHHDTEPEYLIARWDFGQAMHTTRAVDTGPHALHGQLINYPARAMTGSKWNGNCFCWNQCPDQYAAIHFHEDDIYDFEWDTDFSYRVPDDLPSGIYAMALSCGKDTDTIPFFVCPPRGKRQADLCVVIPTFTYVIYGNHARGDYDADIWQERARNWGGYHHNPADHPEYGLSAYNFHRDGSGICHASHLRPLLNLRPGFVTFSGRNCSGLRHLQADTHLISWLDHYGYDCDILTDQELHNEGVEVLAKYKAVTTTSHPEYHTEDTLDALEHYIHQGGHLSYLGGNGFYWRIAQHRENPGILEIRRGEGGIRAWASDPGEYYNAFDGAYGGLWRRSNRPPQRLVGIGFSAQGLFDASYYVPNYTAKNATWILAGISDDKLGNFGFSGGGAAGFELDRVEALLGSPDTIEIIAHSTQHTDDYIVVPEEQLTHVENWAGHTRDDIVRADMAYCTTPNGGKIFSTGSITFCGSLPWNNFDNNISTIMRNVFNRFLR